MSYKVDNDRLAKLGRKLSYLLRHGAVAEGIAVKKNGFVSVDELVRGKLNGYSVGDIERVVASDNKQRFSLTANDGFLEIRANQGHTLGDVVELGLRPVENPDFDIIHGTYSERWATISSRGLSRMKRNHIHFAKGTNSHSGLRKNASIFIHIDFDKARSGGLKFYESTNGVVLCSGDERGIIEPKYFSKVVTRRGKILFPEFP